MIHQVIDGGADTWEYHHTNTFSASVDGYPVAEYLGAIYPLIRGIRYISRLVIQFICLHVLSAAGSSDGSAFHSQPGNLEFALNIGHGKQVAAHPHHGFVLSSYGHNCARNRRVGDGAFLGVELHHVAVQSTVVIPYLRRCGHLRISQDLDQYRGQHLRLSLQILEVHPVQCIQRRISKNPRVIDSGESYTSLAGKSRHFAVESYLARNIGTPGLAASGADGVDKLPAAAYASQVNEGSHILSFLRRQFLGFEILQLQHPIQFSKQRDPGFA